MQLSTNSSTAQTNGTSNGNTLRLLKKTVVRNTTIISNGAIYTSESYYYGRGKMILLDKQNNFVKAARLTYIM